MIQDFPLGVDYIHYMIYDPLKEEAVGVVHKWGFNSGKPSDSKIHWFISQEEQDELRAKIEVMDDLEFWRALINFKVTPDAPWGEEEFKKQWRSVKIALKSDPSAGSLLVRISEEDYHMLLSIHQMIP